MLPHKNNFIKHILCIDVHMHSLCILTVDEQSFTQFHNTQMYNKAQWENQSPLPCSIPNRELIIKLIMSSFISHSE